MMTRPNPRILTPSQRAYQDSLMKRYANREIGIGKVAELLNIHEVEATALLEEYDMDIAFTVEDLEKDLKTAQRFAARQR